MADWFLSLVTALVAGATGGYVVKLASRSKSQPAREIVKEPEPQIDPTKLKTGVLLAIQHNLGTVLPGLTTVVIPLPNPETKGKLIGREGRNIRAFEDITGVDLLIDDRPDSVTLSSLNPRRLALAQITLQNLLLDGRIHPGTISDIYHTSAINLPLSLSNRACLLTENLPVGPLSPPLLKALGELSILHLEGQNLLSQSVESARIAAAIATEIEVNPTIPARLALVQNIRHILQQPQGQESQTIAEWLQKSGESDRVSNPDPKSLDFAIAELAQSIVHNRPGARRPALEDLINHVAELEHELALLPGVEGVVALRSGSEIRLILTAGEVEAKQSNIKAQAREWAAKLLGPSTQVKIVVVEPQTQDEPNP